jgi:hypothetical protein
MRFFRALIASCLLPPLASAAVLARDLRPEQAPRNMIPKQELGALTRVVGARVSAVKKDPQKSPGAPFAAPSADTAELVLANRNLRAVFSSRGLASLVDVRTGSKVTFKDESSALTVNGRAISQAAIGSGDLKVENERLIFGLRAGEFAIRAVYELKPGWHFLTKQICVEAGPASAFRIGEIRALTATLGAAPREELKLSEGRFGTIARFGGQAFTRGQPLAAYDPRFAGGMVKGRFTIPGRVFEQLRRNRETWPVAYTADDLRATWLGTHRLLLFVQIAEPDESIRAALTIDGAPVTLIRAYNSIYSHEPKRTFLGLYAEVTGLDAGREHAFELALPALAPGRFQGLFFENVEPEFTTEIRTESR